MHPFHNAIETGNVEAAFTLLIEAAVGPLALAEAMGTELAA